MHEIILAVLLILGGLIAAGLCLLVIGANAIGGVTNRSAVNLTPAIYLAITAVAAIGGGLWMVFT